MNSMQKNTTVKISFYEFFFKTPELEFYIGLFPDQNTNNLSGCEIEPGLKIGWDISEEELKKTEENLLAHHLGSLDSLFWIFPQSLRKSWKGCIDSKFCLTHLSSLYISDVIEKTKSHSKINIKSRVCQDPVTAYIRGSSLSQVAIDCYVTFCNLINIGQKHEPEDIDECGTSTIVSFDRVKEGFRAGKQFPPAFSSHPDQFLMLEKSLNQLGINASETTILVGTRKKSPTITTQFSDGTSIAVPEIGYDYGVIVGGGEHVEPKEKQALRTLFSQKGRNIYKMFGQNYQFDSPIPTDEILNCILKRTVHEELSKSLTLDGSHIKSYIFGTHGEQDRDGRYSKINTYYGYPRDSISILCQFIHQKME